MKPSNSAKRFIASLKVPTGPSAGKPLNLAPFQKRFIDGALADGVNVGVLSVGRGNGKSALSGGVALAALLGEIDAQPRREVLLAANSRDQARVVFDYIVGLADSLPDEVRGRLTLRKSPRLEIELEDETGPHLIRAIAADGRTILGTSPTLAILDERGHWPADKGDALEHALLSGLGKRGGRALIISTSAASDAHPFSVWLDEDAPGVYRQEHRPPPGLPADDLASIREANPGAAYGIGASLEWLEGQARRAIKRGGSTLTSFRLYNRNERVSAENRDVLLTVDEWLACEAGDVPARTGSVVVGIDLGGSASMTAAALYWPESGRLEVRGWFPSQPGLLDRGQADGVGARYVEMGERGELTTLGAATVPVAPWLAEVMRHIEGEPVSALIADRFKQAELGEAMDRAGVRCPIIWRGMGFKDGGEDVDRFRRAAFDGQVITAPSLLLRSAMADAVVLRDPANNMKLAKARSLGRIDAAAAAVLAVAEGARITARGERKAGRVFWA
ncbi:terminase large subunit domain-containing protein [Wenxinia marina]|uniref:Phage terminase-like protein, large subunit n=1 Tax=Wenxinia marina DSM 24838 TaxID=1123501 RepID=A0A0D0QEK3_9RHOB|nr:terminase large subunit [Wenxinia marina]KIQ70762.1 Phage terminase-like protein, large subunit [Wenxinia marina DSM 24838]GGL80343.1 phage terminase-like protein large subunit [Wenxinia marina]